MAMTEAEDRAVEMVRTIINGNGGDQLGKNTIALLLVKIDDQEATLKAVRDLSYGEEGLSWHECLCRIRDLLALGEGTTINEAELDELLEAPTEAVKPINSDAGGE